MQLDNALLQNFGAELSACTGFVGAAFTADGDGDIGVAENFFKRIRQKNPNVPIVMITRPCAVYGDDEIARREVVKSTYDNAIKNGDKNVYFIDGESFFKDFEDRELCFIDTIHPNDLGFYKMAEVIEPIIKDILEVNYENN